MDGERGPVEDWCLWDWEYASAKWLQTRRRRPHARLFISKHQDRRTVCVRVRAMCVCGCFFFVSSHRAPSLFLSEFNATRTTLICCLVWFYFVVVVAAMFYARSDRSSGLIIIIIFFFLKKILHCHPLVILLSFASPPR